MLVSPDEKRPARRLSGKQKAFIDAYLGPAKLNATEAASIAGYSGDRQGLSVQGSILLSNFKVAGAIARRLAERGASTDELIHRWLTITRFDISDCMDHNGKLDLDKLRDKGLGFLIKGSRPTKEGPVFLLRDPDKAEELLAKHLGTFATQKLKVTHEFATLSDTEAGRRLVALLVAGAEASLASDSDPEQRFSKDVQE